MQRHQVVAQYQALWPLIQHVASLLAEYSGAQEPHAVFDIDDTLIFDDNRQTPNVQIKHLLEVARAYGCKIHLVTAREKSAEVTRWTRDELRRHGIQYDTLVLAPKKARTSMATVAAWKLSERAKHQPLLISVGDQWGDSVLIRSDEDIARLDAFHNVALGPWLIIRPHDGVTEYGVKLMA